MIKHRGYRKIVPQVFVTLVIFEGIQNRKAIEISKEYDKVISEWCERFDPGESMISAGSFCIIPINAKYYSDSVAIIPIRGYIIS